MIIPTEDLEAGTTFADKLLEQIRVGRCCEDCGDPLASVETITLTLLARYSDAIAEAALTNGTERELGLIEGLQSMALVAAVALRRLAAIK
jgi:hypothetical protein